MENIANMDDRQSFLLKAGALFDPLESELLGPHEVLVEDGLIKEVSDRPLSLSGAHTISTPELTLMPGLIDLHVHITATQLNLFDQWRLPNSLVAARTIPIVRGMLRRGFTTIRDAGGADIGWRQAIDAGLVVGPRLFLSGHALSQTGGHGDGRQTGDSVTSFPCGCCFRVGQLSRVVDGVDAVRKAVREELLMGADQIKILASGGVASPTDPVAATGYSEDEIRAIVEEAEARGTYVLAHSYTARAIARAVRCGVRTIEHGNLIDAETATLVKQCGAFVVPTLVTYEALASEGAQLGLPAASVAKICEVREAGLHSLELMQAAGVPMGFGTDLLGPSHRFQSDEFLIRSQVLSTQQVLQSATTTAAEILRMEGRLGRIQPGAFADMLLVRGNPLQNIACLTGNGENIPLVMKGGRICFNELSAA
jgi:imidazolonepropionase-like amidohydrolase